MAEHTKISWCDSTFNPWTGCSKVAAGCEACYAEAQMDLRYGHVQWGPRGTRRRTKTWGQPLAWQRKAAAAGERKKVFCASLADVFEDFEGGPIAGNDYVLSGMADGRKPNALQPWRSDLFKLIDKCPNLDFLLLTKRPENVRRMWDGPNRENCWLGTSLAHQPDVEKYMPGLLSCRGLGPILFVSVEPQIGRIDLSRYLFPVPTIDWVIIGGESEQGGREARLFNIDWARLLLHQCHSARVPVFVKQMGSQVIDADIAWREGDRLPLRVFSTKHADQIAEWPEELQVRQCPENFVPSFDPIAVAT